ncbi:MAG TPA: RNA polymerase sigma factor [Candidatus Saccharimonadales bacterium]|nr:RNA polymerase sigma factor [Candidatus Saccharimonadales bacterium]
MDSTSESEESLVAKAQGGDMDALDALVRRHQSWVFNLALRMVWRRDVAEDATQEILIKAVTKLSTFAGKSAFRTWLYRIAVNHLLNVRKSEMEEQKMTFTSMGASLNGVPDEDLPDERALPVETKVLVEEAKLGCITAMLMCLDRRQRLAFILGEVFGETGAVGAEAMGESAANFRQLLSRARYDLYQFMNDKCGLVNQANPCRCARKANGFMRNGWLDANNLQFSKDRIASVKDVAADRLDELQSLDRKHAEFYRMQPFVAGPDLAQKLREILAQSSLDTN